jgi:integrase
LNAAKAEGLRTGENPALWRGHLDQMLAKRRKADVVHHAALPYAEMPRFWKLLAKDTSDAAGLLRFIILTACRYNEAAGWKEAEVKGDVWTIPAPRMKAGRPHTVPLTGAALACMPVPSVSDVALASCIKRHTNTHATTHGMRSTFRDWVGDESDFSGDLAEQALAHVLPNQTEAAYRRGTALQKRRALMQAWADFCIAKHRT